LAVTKILSIGSCGKGYHGKHFSQALDYIMDKKKTGNGRWTGFLNCYPGDVYAQMQQTKQQFGKVDKRQGYHMILSFEEGEINADTAFELVGKFAKEYLGNSYEALYTVHDNTDHIHGHLIFNSVNFLTGNKFRYEKGDWAKKIQPLMNRLCKEYGLSVIEIPETDGRKKKQSSSKEENVTWADRIKKDLDMAVLQVSSYEAFLSLMAGMGYEIKNAYPQEGSYLAVKREGMARYKRCKSLGEEYTRERIQERISNKTISHQTEGRKEPKIMHCQIKQKKKEKCSPVKNYYSAKFYHALLLKRYPVSKTERYRKDILRMKELQEDYLFLCKYDIHTAKDMEDVAEKIAERRKEVSKEKSQAYKERARKKPWFGIVMEMEDLQICENCFQRGEAVFLEEHKHYQELARQLQKEGYTMTQLRQMEEDMKKTISLVQQKEKEALKEKRIAVRVMEEWNNREQERKRQEEISVRKREKEAQENRKQGESR